MINNIASTRFMLGLLSIYGALMIVMAFNPYDRMTWLAENATVWIILTIIGVLWYRGVRLSRRAYLLMFVLVVMHTVGGHYTFARVPFDFITDTFGFERNHYDRIAHFSVGLYAYAIAEWMTRDKVANRFVTLTYPILVIISIAAVYELIEWMYAAKYGGEAAMLYLGSQGDIWDAQKDILADTLGALVAITYFSWRTHKKLSGQEK